MLLMIDNYDSFTYNLVQYLGELGQEVRVYRNDEIDVEGIISLTPEYLVVPSGPAPGSPAAKTSTPPSACSTPIPRCLNYAG